MNRRNFLGSLVKAFTILPAATTYARNWVFKGPLIIPQSGLQTLGKFDPEYSCVMQPVVQAFYSSEHTFIFDIHPALIRQYLANRGVKKP